MRYIYFNVEQLDGKTIEALSVVSLLVQGFADVIVFGELRSSLGLPPPLPARDGNS